MAAGDILLDRGVRRAIYLHDDEFYPFEKLPSILKNADLVIANLEGALTESTYSFPKKYIFKAPPAYATHLKNAGFDVLSLANNHSYDFGRQGLLDTINALKQSSIIPVGGAKTHSGAMQAQYVTAGNYKIAILGFVTMPLEGFIWRPEEGNPAQAIEHMVQAAICEAKKKADIVIVTVHWGIEFSDTSSANQLRWAELFRKAGADIIFGHHPHVIQPVDVVNGKWIFYSLGNFIFDQTREDGRRALIAKVQICGQNHSVSLIPVDINEAQPRSAGSAGKAWILERLRRISPNIRFMENPDGQSFGCAPKKP